MRSAQITVSHNETTGDATFTVNNTALNPSYSNNIDVDLSTRPSDAFRGWFRKKITGYIISTDLVGDGPDNGFDGQYAGHCTPRKTAERPLLGLRGRRQHWDATKFVPKWRATGASFAYTKNVDGETTDQAGNPVRPIALAFDWHSYGRRETPQRDLHRGAQCASGSSAPADGPRSTGHLYRADGKWDLTALSPQPPVFIEFNGRIAAKGREFKQSGRHPLILRYVHALLPRGSGRPVGRAGCCAGSIHRAKPNP